ncbi:hypothetical protein [Listeria kieliensis]|uniref:Uncharacterized protein n=1 Tax=Listeria kieliensis TaxID=1621700 RepID=A0A3D8TTS6_9LIST|nr:hypothetical protein [Listeria kieliensis]RDX01226.1 hypothetical protein UR08_09830 [Listeria kieliensis]
MHKSVIGKAMLTLLTISMFLFLVLRKYNWEIVVAGIVVTILVIVIWSFKEIDILKISKEGVE